MSIKKILGELNTKDLEDLDPFGSNEHSVILDASFHIGPPSFDDVNDIETMKIWLRFSLRHIETDRRHLLKLRKQAMVQSIILYTCCALASGWLAIFPFVKWLIQMASK